MFCIVECIVEKKRCAFYMRLNTPWQWRQHRDDNANNLRATLVKNKLHARVGHTKYMVNKEESEKNKYLPRCGDGETRLRKMWQYGPRKNKRTKIAAKRKRRTSSNKAAAVAVRVKGNVKCEKMKKNKKQRNKADGCAVGGTRDGRTQTLVNKYQSCVWMERVHVVCCADDYGDDDDDVEEMIPKVRRSVALHKFRLFSACVCVLRTKLSKDEDRKWFATLFCRAPEIIWLRRADWRVSSVHAVLPDTYSCCKKKNKFSLPTHTCTTEQTNFIYELLYTSFFVLLRRE